MVTIDGERIPVHAAIHTMGGLSAHAGQSDLLRWLGSMAGSRPRVVLTHGEDAARATMARLVEERYQIRPEIPALGDVITY